MMTDVGIRCMPMLLSAFFAQAACAVHTFHCSLSYFGVWPCFNHFWLYSITAMPNQLFALASKYPIMSCHAMPSWYPAPTQVAFRF